MGTATSIAPGHEVDLETERAALARARTAVDAKLDRIRGIAGGGADEASDEYIDAVVAATIDKLQHDLVVFGRIDDDAAWRVGLYGIDARRRAARHRLAGAVRREASTRRRFDRSARARPAGQLRRLHRRPHGRGLRHRRGLRLVAADGRAVPQPRRVDAGRRRDAADRAGPARAPRPRPRASCCGAGPARARRSSASTARRGSSTTTAASPPTASSCSARATASCASCPRCCRRSARPASTRPRSTACSGPSERTGSDERWLDVLDRFEADLYRPPTCKVGLRRVRRGRGRRADRTAHLPGDPVAGPAQDPRRALLATRLERTAAGRSAEADRRRRAGVDQRKRRSLRPDCRRRGRSTLQASDGALHATRCAPGSRACPPGTPT